MNLKEEVTEKLKDAMRSKDKLKLSTYRSILTAITNNEKSAKQITDIDLLSTLAKQRKQSIEQFEIGGNIEAANQEKEELIIIEEFLPNQMSDTAILAAVMDIINEIGDTISMRDMGRVIGMFKSKHTGQDMTKVSLTIKNHIENK